MHQLLNLNWSIVHEDEHEHYRAISAKANNRQSLALVWDWLHKEKNTSTFTFCDILKMKPREGIKKYSYNRKLGQVSFLFPLLPVIQRQNLNQNMHINPQVALIVQANPTN